MAEASNELDFAAQAKKLLMDAGLGFESMPSSVTPSTIDTSTSRASLGRVQEAEQLHNLTISAQEKRLGAIRDEQKASVLAQGDAKSQMELAAQAKAQAIADATAKFNDMFGLSPDGQIAEIAKRVRETKPNADAMLSVVTQLKSVNPLDDPIGWIQAGLALPSATAQYNQLAMQVNSDTNLINESIKQSTDAAAQMIKTLPAITVDQARAAAKVALEEAKTKASVLDIAHSHTVVSLSQSRLANAVTAANATKDSTQLDLQISQQRLQADIANATLATNQAERLLKAGKIYQELADTEGLKPILENAARITGRPVGSLTPTMIKLMKPAERDNLIAIGTTNSFGVNPYDAFVSAAQSGIGQDAPPEVRDFLNYISGKLTIIGANPMMQKLPPELKAGKFGEELKKLVMVDMETAAKDISSPFHELSPAKMFMRIPSLAESEIGKALAPIATIDTPTIPSQIAAVLLKASNNDFNKAGAMLSNYYRANVIERNTVLSYRAFGIEPPEVYKVSVGGMFTKIVLDLTKPGDAVKYQQYQFMQQARQDLQQDTANSSATLGRDNSGMQ